MSNQQTYFFIPKYVTERAIYLYLALLSFTVVVFFYDRMPLHFILIGILSVIGFFYYINKFSKEWITFSVKNFEKVLWKYGILIRLSYVIISYFFYLYFTGVPFEFHAADSYIYHLTAEGCVSALTMENWSEINFPDLLNRSYGRKVELSDSGYPIYLSIIYLLTNKSIFIARCIKVVWSTWTVVLIYRLTRREFGDNVGRMAAICCLLMPNLIYYCGLHLKETEMLFVTVLFLERSDAIIRSRTINLKSLLIIALMNLLLFTFRTVLGVIAFLSLIVTLVMSTKRMIPMWRKILLSILTILFVGLVYKNNLHDEVAKLADQNIIEQQQSGLQWRANEKTGNRLANKIGAAVFAPLIITIPFPTMINTPEQENQQMIHGGNFVKNVLSGFVIVALVMLFLSGEWREHVLILAFLAGYLIVLVFSNFAHSERFHIPILPIELILASYGISILKPKHKFIYNYWLVGLFVADIGWTFFKLIGKGLL